MFILLINYLLMCVFAEPDGTMRKGMAHGKLKIVIQMRGQSKTRHIISGHVETIQQECALSKASGHITRVYANEYVANIITGVVTTLIAIIIETGQHLWSNKIECSNTLSVISRCLACTRAKYIGFVKLHDLYILLLSIIIVITNTSYIILAVV